MKKTMYMLIRFLCIYLDGWYRSHTHTHKHKHTQKNVLVKCFHIHLFSVKYYLNAIFSKQCTSGIRIFRSWLSHKRRYFYLYSQQTSLLCIKFNTYLEKHIIFRSFIQTYPDLFDEIWFVLVKIVCMQIMANYTTYYDIIRFHKKQILSNTYKMWIKFPYYCLKFKQNSDVTCYILCIFIAEKVDWNPNLL